MQYKFQHVFDEDASQKAVFDNAALPLIEDLLKGKNSKANRVLGTRQGRINQGPNS